MTNGTSPGSLPTWRSTLKCPPKKYSPFGYVRHVDVQISSMDRFQGLSHIFPSIAAFCVRFFWYDFLSGTKHLVNRLFQNDETHATLWMVFVETGFWRVFMCFQGLENLVEHHFEGTWKTEAWQVFFVARGGNPWPWWFSMVFSCPMLVPTMGGFMEERNALQMFDGFISCLIMF